MRYLMVPFFIIIVAYQIGTNGAINLVLQRYFTFECVSQIELERSGFTSYAALPVENASLHIIKQSPLPRVSVCLD